MPPRKSPASPSGAKAKKSTAKPKAKKTKNVSSTTVAEVTGEVPVKRKFGGPQPGAGRPSKYTTELGERICERLAKGETLIGICRDEGMPDERTVRDWSQKDGHEFPPKYAQAREAGYRRMAEELLEISDDSSRDYMAIKGPDGIMLVPDKELVARSRLRADTRKWLLSKALPKIYGDKVFTEMTGRDGAPLLPDGPNPRDMARAVLDLLREAKVSGGDQGE